MALPYDFYINDSLGFNTFITTEQPYERATAQFRKDQFDSTPTVGDQSLAGWWTRGQLSFHRGAGVKYYDLVAGETVSERFRTSLGVDVWEPGEVTLASAVVQIEMPNVLDAVPYAPSGSLYETPANLVSNGGFEVNATGWESNTGFGTFTAAAFARSTTRGHTGTASLRATWPTGTRSWVDTLVTGLTPGQSYVATAWVWVPLGDPDVQMEVLFNSVGTSTSLKAQWVEVTLTFLATSTSHFVGVSTLNPASGQLCYIDDVTVMVAGAAGEGVGALLGNGSVQLASAGAPGQVLPAYSDEGIISITSSGSSLYACTPSSIQKQGAGTEFQYVTNPAFDAGGDTSFVSGVGGATPAVASGLITYTSATVADGAEFEVPVIATGARVNLVANPSFETSEVGWVGSGNTTINRASGFGAEGFCGFVTSGHSVGEVHTIPFGVTAGDDYSAQVTLRPIGTQRTVTIAVEWYNISDVFISTSTVVASFTESDTWRTVGGAVTAPALATSGVLSISFNSTAVGEGHLIDRVMVEQSSQVEQYFDGSTTTLVGYACAWTGVPHQSSSTATPSGTADGAYLCRVTADRDVDIKAWDGAAFTSLGPILAADVRHSFFVTADAGDVKFQVMAAPGDVGVTHINELSVTSAVSESATPNAADDSRWVWRGSANDSIQSRAVLDGNLHVLWAPPTGLQWSGAWHAKGRLFAVDSTGRWYALSATSGGVANVNDHSFWFSGIPNDWAVAEGSSTAYFAQGSDIYMLTLDTDSLVPSVAAPVVTATLPSGEVIASLYSYLGRVLIATNRGVRAAVVQSDGSLAYGSRFIEGDFSGCTRIGTNGDIAYVTGIVDEDGASAAVYEVNMTVDVETLVPAHARLRVVDGNPYGAVLGADGNLYVFDDDGFWVETDGLVGEGTLTTGFHRLGTLDPKSFQYLRVRTEGTVGSIDVSVLLPDGSTSAVGSVDAGDSLDLSLRTAVPNPVEFIALVFALNGDGTDGPTLLGYQLKALPVPKRQRMIRVPLMLFDDESNRSGQKMIFDPWDRLAALEALEESNAVVTFSDTETGEIGDAYIETIEVQRTAASARGPGGFGGVLYLTLRRL